MTETGILEYFERRYPAVNDTCSRIKEEMAKVRALTLQGTGAAFLVLGAGISAAMTVLFLELIVQSVQKAFTRTSATESISRAFDMRNCIDRDAESSFSKWDTFDRKSSAVESI